LLACVKSSEQVFNFSTSYMLCKHVKSSEETLSCGPLLSCKHVLKVVKKH
jgi:hypothetical protein